MPTTSERAGLAEVAVVDPTAAGPTAVDTVAVDGAAVAEGAATQVATIERDGILAGQILLDSLVIGVAAAVAIGLVRGSGTFVIILWSLGLWVALFIVALLVHAIFNATRETLPRKILGWACVAGILYAATRPWIGGWDGGWAGYLAGFSFLFTSARTVLLHPRQDAEFRSERAEEAGSRALAEHLARAAREPGKAALPPAIDRGLAELPAELAPELRRLIQGALEDLTHLFELANDPAISGRLGGCSQELAREGEAVALELLRRAPLIDRMARLAARRAQDQEAEEAARRAQETLREQAKALHDAASALLQLAASDPVEAVAELREHIEGLHALREARDELERELRS